MYVVTEYEVNRYEGGFVVHRRDAKWGDFIATFPGGNNLDRAEAQALADRLNNLGKDCPACEVGAERSRDARHHPGFAGKRYFKCRRSA